MQVFVFGVLLPYEAHLEVYGLRTGTVKGQRGSSVNDESGLFVILCTRREGGADMRYKYEILYEI